MDEIGHGHSSEPAESEPGEATPAADRSRQRERRRRLLRRVGLVLQTILCTGLVVWTLLTQLYLYALIAAVLAGAAVALLWRDLRAGDR